MSGIALVFRGELNMKCCLEDSLREVLGVMLKLSCALWPWASYMVREEGNETDHFNASAESACDD